MPKPIEIETSQPRDFHGRFSDKNTPPIVSMTVTNPVTYLKLWWQKTMNNEGIDLHLRIHPLTALAASLVFALGGFGLGRFIIPAPIVKYIPQFGTPSATPNPWKDTAFSGMLRYSTITKKFYLETQQAEAITLETPTNVDLTKYIGRRIFATGQLNAQTNILKVGDTQDLELLPTTVTHVQPASTPSPSISP